MLNSEQYVSLLPPISGGLPLLQSTTKGGQSEPNSPQSSRAGDKNPTMEHGVYVRVHKSLIQPTSPAATTSMSATHPPPTNPSSSHLYLIAGSIQDIERYAGSTLDWVIKIAHLICSPLHQGRVYTHTTGTIHSWYHQDRGMDWRLVAPGDPLVPGIYEFDADFSVVLSRLSQRQAHSVTSVGSQSNSSTFRRHIEIREGGRCAASNLRQVLIASHLIPKRMGTEGVKSVVADFVGALEAQHAHNFHAMIGILLTYALEKEVTQYMLGFYHIAGNTYALHHFDATQNLNFLGLEFDFPPYSDLNLPLLHSHQVTLSSHGGNEILPPSGVFNWHYLQCVAKQFATSEYKSVRDIHFYDYPFKIVSDESHYELEFHGNDDIEPPYPTFMAEQGRKQMIDERNQEVALWSTGIAPGIYDT